MASPRRLEIPQESLDEPSMIPYSQSSQKNGGKAKARNAYLMLNRLRQANYKTMMKKLLLKNKIPKLNSNPRYNPRLNDPTYTMADKLRHQRLQQQLNYEIKYIGG